VSFQAPSPDMLKDLEQLLSYIPVAIITAAGWSRIEQECIAPLHSSPHIDRLFIFPNSSAECLTFQDGTWRIVYRQSFTDDERRLIHQVVEEEAAKAAVREMRSMVIDRGPQVAYAAIGLDASLEEKRAWDPDQSKRKRLQHAIIARIPDVDVLIGGMTTIDITKKGVNKAYGVRWLAEHLGCRPNEMFYVGDAFYEGGNDAIVIPTGVAWRAVEGPEETLAIVKELLQVCAGV
jgi:phosphomannomutase